jgi:hypothetical protein
MCLNTLNGLISFFNPMKQPIESSQVDLKAFETDSCHRLLEQKVLQKGMEGGHTWQQQQFSPVHATNQVSPHGCGQWRLAAAHKCQVCKADVQVAEV